MEKGLWDGAYMRILLNGKWHVVLEDGTTGQMDLPGTLDENGIGHRDVGANQWHPDAVLGNAAGEIDKDAPIATRFTRRHTYEGEARISRNRQAVRTGGAGTGTPAASGWRSVFGVPAGDTKYTLYF